MRWDFSYARPSATLAFPRASRNDVAMTTKIPSQKVRHPGIGLRLRIILGDDAMLGPGKAELLERIRDTGSISAAGRQMAMSYKRAWMLVEEMNAAFAEPLVDSARGGTGGGGAQLSAFGGDVLARYRAVERAAAEAGAKEIAALQAMLKPQASNDMSEEK